MSGPITAAELGELARRHLGDPAATWSVGAFGAIAEFLREPQEPVDLVSSPDEVTARTPRGGLRLVLRDGVRPVAWERPTGSGGCAGTGWTQAVALCLPATQAAMHRRDVLTELGPDRSALHRDQAGAVLFDLGLGTWQVDVCVRTSDPDLLRVLREGAERPLFEPGNPVPGAVAAAGPHRVLLTRIARAEVHTPIPPPDGTSPDGPHTHLLPDLLRHGRTHAATDPVPDGWVPVAQLFPAHPLHDALGRPIPFDPARCDAFGRLLDRFGDPAAVAQKRTVANAVAAGRPPSSCPPAAGRVQRAARRVAVRQLLHRGVDVPPAWRAAADSADSAGSDPATGP